MLKYKVNVCGCVCGTDTDFKVGKSIQDAIDGMKGKGHPIEKPEPVKPAGQDVVSILPLRTVVQ